MKLLIFLLLTVGCFAQVQNLLDPNNSTATHLGASGTFTGHATYNVGSNKFTTVITSVATNKVSTTGGYKIQVTNDTVSGIWVTIDSTTAVAGTVVTMQIVPTMAYYRITYTNTNDSITASYFAIQTFRTTMAIISGTPTVVGSMSIDSTKLYDHNDTLYSDVNNFTDTTVTSATNWRTTILMDGKHQWYFFSVGDTISNSRTDTITFKTYSSFLGSYRSQRVGIWESKTNDLIADSTLITSVSISKEYAINVPYARGSLEIAFPNSTPLQVNNKSTRRGFRVTVYAKRGQ